MRIAVLCLAAMGAACASPAATPPACTAASCLPLERGDDGSPIIAARVNGEGPFFFVLDTAASGTNLNEEAVERLGVSPIGAEEAQGIGGGVDVRLFRIAAIGAGPLHAVDQITPEFPAPDFESHDLTGLAGVNLFGDQLILWDLAAMELRVGASGGEPVGDWTPVAANWLQPWKVMLPISIDGVVGEALLDTGAQRTVLNGAYAQALGLDLTGATPVDEIAGIDGAPQPLYGVELDEAEVGAWWFRDQRAYVGDLAVFHRLGDPDRPLAILGVDWLSGRRFAVDYGARRVWVEAQ